MTNTDAIVFILTCHNGRPGILENWWFLCGLVNMQALIKHLFNTRSKKKIIIKCTSDAAARILGRLNERMNVRHKIPVFGSRRRSYIDDVPDWLFSTILCNTNIPLLLNGSAQRKLIFIFSPIRLSCWFRSPFTHICCRHALYI